MDVESRVMDIHKEIELQRLARLHRSLNPPKKSVASQQRRTWKRLNKLKQLSSMMNMGNAAWLKSAPADERTKRLLAAYRRRLENKIRKVA